MTTRVVPGYPSEPPPSNSTNTLSDSELVKKSPSTCKHRVTRFLRRPPYGSTFGVIYDGVYLILICMYCFSPMSTQERSHTHQIIYSIGSDTFDVTDQTQFWSWLFDDYLPDVQRVKRGLRSTYPRLTPTELSAHSKGSAFQKSTGRSSSYTPEYSFIDRQNDTPILIPVNLARLVQRRRRRPKLCDSRFGENAKNDQTYEFALKALGVNCSAEYLDSYPFGSLGLSNGTLLRECPFKFQTVSRNPKNASELRVEETFPFKAKSTENSLDLYEIEFPDMGYNPDWKAMLIRCGWLDAKTVSVIVSTPVVVPSAYYFAEMVHELEFLPCGAVIESSKLVKGVDLSFYDVAVHALIPHNWFSNFGRPSTYFYWLVINVMAFPKIIWMLHGGLVDSGWIGMKTCRRDRLSDCVRFSVCQDILVGVTLSATFVSEVVLIVTSMFLHHELEKIGFDMENLSFDEAWRKNSEDFYIQLREISVPERWLRIFFCIWVISQLIELFRRKFTNLLCFSLRPIRHETLF